MYVPSAAPNQSQVRRFVRFLAWHFGDIAAAAIARVRGFRIPDEPLTPYAHKLPMLIGTYERELVALMKSMVRPGMTVIDGGAHVGYFTVLLSRLVGPSGRVFAFEIHPTTLEMLQENTRNLGNVTIVPAALGDKDGEAIIYESAGLSSGHSAHPDKPGLAAGQRIACRSIRSILAEHGRPHADFLKLDIEGGEPAILAALCADPAARPFSAVFEVKRYILEGSGNSPEAVILDLLSAGLTVRPVGGEAFTPRNLPGRADELTKANLLAIAAVEASGAGERIWNADTMGLTSK